MQILNNKKGMLILLALVMVGFGIFFRFYRITESDFVFYDEGYYLNYNRDVMLLISRHEPDSFQEFFAAFSAYLRASLASAKALWFTIVNFRVYAVGYEGWFFPRVVSALAGALTLVVFYFFAKRFYRSRAVAWIAVVWLSLFPGHVFYSRLAIQEALSTLLVLLGFAFYLFPRRLHVRTIFSALFFGAAFFTNYRLIVLPLLVAVTEGWLAWSSRKRFDLRKIVWHTVTFLAVIFLVGALDGGQNTYITFGWMFHQAHLAQRPFSWLNLLSYPYYLFRLENILLAAAFFASGLLLFKRQRRLAWPFVLVLLHMLIFSFASDQGARYLCVMYPFIVMSAAYMMVFFLKRQEHNFAKVLVLLVVFAVCAQTYLKSWALAQSGSDYRPATEELLSRSPNTKFLSTQNFVQNLYVQNPGHVQVIPEPFEALVASYAEGYRYLVLCPQVYVSWGQDNERFQPRLKGYLDYMSRNIPPMKVYPHFNALTLERFVFDHNQDLATSIRFLQSAPQQGYGRLRVYDVSQVLDRMFAVLQQVTLRSQQNKP